MKKVESKSIPVPIDAAMIEEETFVIAAIAEEAPRIARANSDILQRIIAILPKLFFFFGLGLIIASFLASVTFFLSFVILVLLIKNKFVFQIFPVKSIFSWRIW